MEKLHETAGVTGDAVCFRNEVQADLAAPTSMSDLTPGWEAYLDLHVTAVTGAPNPSRQSLSARRARCGSPTQSDLAKVCFSHWYMLACR